MTLSSSVMTVEGKCLSLSIRFLIFRLVYETKDLLIELVLFIEIFLSPLSPQETDTYSNFKKLQNERERERFFHSRSSAQ